MEHTGRGTDEGIPEWGDAAGFASPAGVEPARGNDIGATAEWDPAARPGWQQQPTAQPGYQAAAQPMMTQPMDQAPTRTEYRPPQPPQAAPAPPQAAGPRPPQSPRISPLRAFGEIGAVYFVSFGLGVVSAIGLLTDPSLGSNQVIKNWIDAASEIMQYIMQAAVVILGVGYFSLRRGVTLPAIFGRFSRPVPPAAPVWPAYQQPYAQQYQPGSYPGYPYPQYGPYGYAPNVREPAQRGRGWQFTRAFFVSMAGVLAFLIAVIVYVALSGHSTSAPDQGNSLWLIPVGAVVALAAGLGEEVLITGMVTTTLEQAGFAKRAWVIYLVAIALRIPFHLYYGWASLGVVCFTVVNIWVYRRWRLLWPIVLAHTTYDAIEFAGSLVPKAAGLILILLGLVTFVMVIVIGCVELSDRSARRRFNQWRAAVGPGY